MRIPRRIYAYTNYKYIYVCVNIRVLIDKYIYI